MDARRALPFLLLVICTINAAVSIHNDRGGGPSNVRRVRRISEYLVPPPPPGFHSPSGRLPRLASYQSANEPGYFARLMNWLNPFSSQSSPPLPPPPPPQLPPPPLPPQPETYPPKFIQSDSLPLATTYNGPALVDYEKPPLPPSSVHEHSGYSAAAKIKNCNSCNKVPWMPIQQSEPTHSGNVPYALPPPSLVSSLNHHGGYPPRNPEDTYHAASQEIRAPDYSFSPPLPGGQDNSFIGPLPNPHLYPGAMPPLFKAEDFNHSPQVIPGENSGYLGATSSASVSGNDAPTGSFLDGPRPAFNGEHNGQSEYLGPSGQSGAGIVPQEPGYVNPGASNGEHYHQDHAAPGDLSSSGTQVSGHANPVPDKQGLEGNNQGTFDSTNHQTFLGGSDVLNDHPPRVPNNGGSIYITGSSGSAGGFLDDTSQTDPNFPSYGISDLDKVPNNYEHNDLSPSAEDSRAPLYGSDGTSGKIRDSINFEESPLIDFTHKDESRTHSSPIPSTSNAFAGSESTVNTGAVAPGDEIFGVRQGVTSTESHFSADYFETIDTVAKELNNSAIQDTAREPFRDVLLKPYDDVTDETLNGHINANLDVASEQQGGKRNKQVQVIIPYTSQYTPLPFHPSDDRKISDTGEPNHDSYVGEESRNRINVVKPPNASPIFQFRPTTLPIFEDATKKAGVTKANNSIDVHKLQKNIDNWTIQKYSKSITATTVSPSHRSSPYLLPSKTIPKEYFTTTEPIVADNYNGNVKTFTLAGFSFNDQEYKGSASYRMEGPRIHVIKAENWTESPTDAPVKDMWRGFPVGISSDKERVYIVTPETPTTPISNPENRRSKAKEVESNTMESKKASQTNVKETKKSDTFESIEKAYQVLPQAVNNLAVASTGPESVPLWGIMEHDDFASPVDNEYDNNDTEPSVLYSRLSKKSRSRR